MTLLKVYSKTKNEPSNYYDLAMESSTSKISSQFMLLSIKRKKLNSLGKSIIFKRLSIEKFNKVS